MSLIQGSMDPNIYDAEGNICIVNVSLHLIKNSCCLVNRLNLNFIAEHGGSVEAVGEAAQRRPD